MVLAENPNVQGFMHQVSDIFESNSLVANLIAQIESRGIELSFSVADLVDPAGGDKQAQTNPNYTGNSIEITFDLTNMDANGWSTLYNANGTATPTAHATAEQSILNTIVHELNHALISSYYMEARTNAIHSAQNQGLNSLPPNAIYDELVFAYGQDVANIFFTVDASGQAIANNANQVHVNHHSYMYQAQSDYNNYLYSALQEFANDLADYEQYLEELENWAQQEGEDYGGPGAEEGS